MTVEVLRDAGHPWSSAAGWDKLSLRAETVEALDAMISNAESKRWRVWVRDQHEAAAVMYKPSGATAAWEDLPRHGTPRENSLALAVGDPVYTDYSGRITRHVITARELDGTWSQTGCRLRVHPPVPGSGFVADDPGSKVRQRGAALMDAAWFRPAA